MATRVYQAREHQPRIPNGGRINDVAIDPSNSNHVLATSETGGLWQSTDGGTNWQHVDALPVFNTNAVHFVTANPRVVLVSAREDLQQIAHRIVRPSGDTTVVTSGGGLWLSRDGGASWAMPAAAVPMDGAAAIMPGACNGRKEAFDIDEDPETRRVFVATNCGISFSDDIATAPNAGWTHRFLALSSVTPKKRQFSAVAALDGNGVVVGGGDGAFYSSDNGRSWQRSSTEIGEVLDFHAAARAPGRTDAGFVISIGPDNDRVLWRSVDGGRTWQLITSDPDNSRGCGGIAHIYAFPQRVVFRERRAGRFINIPMDGTGIYFGNSCHTYRHFTGPTLQDVSRMPEWFRLGGSHADTRAVAFLPADLMRPDSDLDEWPEARFLASDGGLDRREGNRFVPIGAGPSKINALQLYDLEGQWVRETGQYRLAFGTQDNGLWSSLDETNWPASQSTGPELGAIQMPRITSRDDPSLWTYVTCAGCAIQMSDPLFQSQVVWPGYATKGSGWGFSAPRRVHPTALGTWRVQVVFPDRDLIAADEKLGLELTSDLGTTFLRFAEPPEEPRGPMNVVRGVVYQAVVRGNYVERTFEGVLAYKDTELLRASTPLRSTSDTTYPAMNGFGSMGHTAFQFAWNPAYAVNPTDPNHLIAQDVQNRTVMMSRDGGENWSEIAGLAGQLSRGGRFQLALPSAFGSFSFSLVSAISFCPDNPDLVLLGTQLGGAYLSQDGGVSWRHVPGSEGMVNILDFDWKSEREIYVATYGRGLWKIEFEGLVFDLDALRFYVRGRRDILSLRHVSLGGMYVVPISATAPAPPAAMLRSATPMPLEEALTEDAFDAVIIAVNGSVTGLTAGKTTEERIVATPGAVLYTFASDRPQPGGQQAAVLQPRDLKLPEQLGRELARKLELKPPPGPREVELAALNELGLTAASAKRLGIVAPQGRENAVDGTTEPPIARTVGVGFKDGAVTGVIIGAGATYRPPEGQVVFKPSDRQGPAPAFDGGYVRLPPSGPVYFGGPVYGPETPMRIEGQGFSPGRSVAIEVDGEEVAAVQPNLNGLFATTISLRHLLPGIHQLFVRQDLGNGTEDTDVHVFVIHPEDRE